ncbi:MAG: hypothetical protein MJB14_19205, partial [Spirochaetes bacterium]|nr:hypothetical protein [Spirochaetota bacterium]
LYKNYRIHWSYDQNQLPVGYTAADLVLAAFNPETGQSGYLTAEKAGSTENSLTFLASHFSVFQLGILDRENQQLNYASRTELGYEDDFYFAEVVYQDNSVTHNKKQSAVSAEYLTNLPLILSYQVNEKEQKVNISWNKPDTLACFVYKRLPGQTYQLLGIANTNYYEDELTENASYLVTTVKDLFLRSVNNYHLISNEITIDLSAPVQPAEPHLAGFDQVEGKKVLSWENHSFDTDRFFVYKYVQDQDYYYTETQIPLFTDHYYEKGEKSVYLVWALDKSGNASAPLVYLSEDADSMVGVYRVHSSKTTKITYHNLQLEIDPRALPVGSYIAVGQLEAGSMRPQPGNITNVTEGEGYYVTVNGDPDSRLLKEVKLAVPYDVDKLPEELSEKNILTYYFDEKKGKWLTFNRVEIDRQNSRIVNKTSHFCQFYTGAASVQAQPPQAKGINTNPVNIDAVDPLAGIKGIAPPVPNNMGTANVSYPIDVPEGVNGMTPGISINYSSESKEGNCGIGWNLGESTITIQTKNKGVPKYDNSTDTLLFDGMELVEVETDVYRLKNEGSFSKIVKSGNSFIVYQTDGSKLYYGLTENERLADPSDLNKIYIWKLSKIEDSFENTITYQYGEVLEGGKRVNLYLETIFYGYNDVYTVNFTWEERIDDRISYISGFRINNNKRLKEIAVKHDTTELKKDELVYLADIQNKSILKKILEIKDGNTINEQEFEYQESTNKIDTPLNHHAWLVDNAWGSVFDRYPIHIDNDNTRKTLLDMNGDGLADRISHRYNGTYGIYVGLNNGSGFDTPTKWLANNEWGSSTDRYPIYTDTDGNTCQTLLDMNGDGLPDRVSHRYNGTYGIYV